MQEQQRGSQMSDLKKSLKIPNGQTVTANIMTEKIQDTGQMTKR